MFFSFNLYNFKRARLPITNKQSTDSREVGFRGIRRNRKRVEDKHARHSWDHEIQLKVKITNIRC